MYCGIGKNEVAIFKEKLSEKNVNYIWHKNLEISMSRIRANQNPKSEKEGFECKWFEFEGFMIVELHHEEVDQ